MCENCNWVQQFFSIISIRTCCITNVKKRLKLKNGKHYLPQIYIYFFIKIHWANDENTQILFIISIQLFDWYNFYSSKGLFTLHRAPVTKLNILSQIQPGYFTQFKETLFLKNEHHIITRGKLSKTHSSQIKQPKKKINAKIII